MNAFKPALILIAACTLSYTAFADSSNLSKIAGVYEGITRKGDPCSISISANETQITNVQMGWSGKRGNGCGFSPKKTKLQTNSIKVSGGSEFSVCKAQLELGADGSVIAANLGIGMFIQIGYDVACLQMVRK